MKAFKSLFAVVLALLATTAAQAQDPHKPAPAQYQTPVLKAIAYGLSAPNPHNTQAWYIDTLSATEMYLYLKHALPETDPPARQLIIGAGCFAECARIGMGAEGYSTEITFLPLGDYLPKKFEIGEKPIAKLKFRKEQGIKKDELYDYLYQRQSNRSKYKGATVTEAEFEQLRKWIGNTHSELIFVNSPEKMKPIQTIFSKAMEIETRLHRTSDETRHNFRFSERERATTRDGLSLATNGFSGMMLGIAEKTMHQGDSATWHSERMVKATVKGVDKAIFSAKGLVFFKTAHNTKEDWFWCGRDFVRYNIAVAKLGLATSHFNQVLQEYPEMQTLQNQFNALQNVQPDEKIQLALRIGRAKPSYKSWRRDVESFILKK